MGYKIAIDGPSGCGKGYVADQISKRLGILNIDTGAMYRAFGLYCENNKIDLSDEFKVSEALDKAKITFVYNESTPKILLNGVDVSIDIRTERVGKLASIVSSLPYVRQYMVERQRALAGDNDVIMEGRDIGSVVFPNAELKIFLTADVYVRAQRRYKDLILKNNEITLEQVIEEINQRDKIDSTKAISPLVKTKDMIEIDTSNLSKEQVVDEVMKLVKQKGLVKFD